MSFASTPAHASARMAATCDSSVIGTCDTRRSLIPVRVVIHSSVVSMKLARPALSSTAGGMHLPQPVMAAYVMAGHHTPGLGRGGYTARRPVRDTCKAQRGSRTRSPIEEQQRGNDHAVCILRVARARVAAGGLRQEAGPGQSVRRGIPQEA